MITLRFAAGRGLASQLVQLATWSWASHVDIELGGGYLLGAVPGKGVCLREAEIDDARVERYAVDLNPVAAAVLLRHARSQLGRPYDWPGVLGYGLRRDWQEQDSWFCSELVAWVFAQTACPLLRGEQVWRITPRDLLMSPLLEPLPCGPGSI